MSDLVGTIDAINAATLRYVPVVIAGVHAAEVSGSAGKAKKQAVMDGILAGAKAGEQIAQPQVRAIAGMIDLFVSIFNALGVFKKKP